MELHDQPLGTISRGDDDRWVLRYERRLDHPRRRSGARSPSPSTCATGCPRTWWASGVQGATLELPFWPETIERYGDRIDGPTVMHGEIRVWEPPSVFEWTWDVDLLRWELDPAGDGTHLTFTTWLGDPEIDAIDPAAGYHFCLDQLAELLDRGSTTKPDDAAIERRQREYAANGQSSALLRRPMASTASGSTPSSTAR